jgi:hypothetical protein
MLDLPVNKVEDGAPVAPAEPEQAPARSDRPVLTLLRPSVTSYSAPAETSLPATLSPAPAVTLDAIKSWDGELAVPPSAPPEVEKADPTSPRLSLADLAEDPDELPVAPPSPVQESEPAASVEANRAPSVAPGSDKNVEPSAAEEWVPFSSNWRPSSQTWGPLRESWQKARAPESSPVPRTALPEAPVAESPARPPTAPATATKLLLPATLQEPTRFAEPEEPDSEPLPALPASLDLPPLPWWAWPLAGLNAGFDLVVAPLGAPGRWLRGKRGKDLLGLVGLLALAVAAGLVVADWYGWTW